MSTNGLLRRRALKIEQDPKHPVFLFSLTADQLLQIADISRVSRDEAGKLLGYQRPEVKKHVRNIVEYLDGGPVIFPNSIIIALSSGITFQHSRGPKVDEGGGEAGTLNIPIPANGGPKPAWIVDGQQRVLALSKSKARALVVPVNAFIADEIEVQRDQFIRINSAKPLPRSLVTELLPEISTTLPVNLAVKRAPSAICDLLNKLPASPFAGLIRRPSAPTRDAIITDTALISSIQESLTQANGCLFPCRNVATGETDFDAVIQILVLYWSAVKETFADAWGLPPAKSRLMHGVGIRSMGKLADRVMGAVNVNAANAKEAIKRELATIKPHCRWISGVWEELDGKRWDDLQNTPNDIKVLSNYLMRLYANTRWSSR